LIDRAAFSDRIALPNARIERFPILILQAGFKNQGFKEAGRHARKDVASERPEF
jgi:hypothetical protein